MVDPFKAALGIVISVPYSSFSLVSILLVIPPSISSISASKVSDTPVIFSVSNTTLGLLLLAEDPHFSKAVARAF